MRLLEVWATASCESGWVGAVAGPIQLDCRARSQRWRCFQMTAWQTLQVVAGHEAGSARLPRRACWGAELL